MGGEFILFVHLIYIYDGPALTYSTLKLARQTSILSHTILA